MAYEYGGQPSTSTTQANTGVVQQKPLAKNAENKSLVTLPLTNEQVIPKIMDLSISGKQREKLNVEKPKKEGAYRRGVDSLALEQRRIRQALNSGGLDRVYGVVGMFKSLPGSPAADAEALIASIKNMEFLANYKEIKASGGGLGSLTEREAVRLEELRTALTKTQSADRAREMLVELDQILERQKTNDKQDYMVEYGDINYEPAFKLPPINVQGSSSSGLAGNLPNKEDSPLVNKWLNK